MPEFHGVKGFKYLSGRGLEFTDPMEDDMMETWEEEDDTSQFDVDLNWGESSRQSGGDKLLVGKLFATKKQGLEVLKDLIQRAWRPKGKVGVSVASPNMYVFSFDNPRDIDKVLKDSPWTINGNLLNVQRWEQGKRIDQIELSRCLIWVQISSLPWDLQTMENIVKLGSKIGIVKGFEDPVLLNACYRDFVRIRVEIDVTQPLITELRIPTPQGQRFWARVNYEKLKGFCYKCGVIGHGQEDCVAPVKMSLATPSQRRYSGSLYVKPQQILSALIVHNPEGGDTVEISMRRESSSKTSRGGSQSDTTKMMQVEGRGHGPMLRNVEQRNPLVEDRMEISESLPTCDSIQMSEGGKEEDEVNSPTKLDLRFKKPVERGGKSYEPDTSPDEGGTGSGSSRDKDTGRNSDGKVNTVASSNLGEAGTTQEGSAKRKRKEKVTSSEEKEDRKGKKIMEGDDGQRQAGLVIVSDIVTEENITPSAKRQLFKEVAVDNKPRKGKAEQYFVEILDDETTRVEGEMILYNVSPLESELVQEMAAISLK